jgi:hypothetical protein
MKQVENWFFDLYNMVIHYILLLQVYSLFIYLFLLFFLK